MAVSLREHVLVRRRIETYLDGEADAVLALRVRRHLAECWACSENAEWSSLTKGALARFGLQRPPDLAAVRLHRYASALMTGR